MTSGDPLSNMAVEFKSPEDAMEFCEKNGMSILSTPIPEFISCQNGVFNNQLTYASTFVIMTGWLVLLKFVWFFLRLGVLLGGEERAQI